MTQSRIVTGPAPAGSLVHGWIVDRAVLAVGERIRRRALARARRQGVRVEGPLVAVRNLLATVGEPPGPWRAAVEVVAIWRLLQSLDRPAASAVLAGLTDAEVRAWHARLALLPSAARDATYVVVGERVTLDQWRRFGSFTNDVDPDPSGDLRDLARMSGAESDALAAQVRRWESWQGPLAVRGPGDAHAYDANDVLQGHIGNCYLVAALQALADVAPHRLAGLCQPNPNGTWTVTLPGGRRTVVSPDVVVDVHGRAIFARRPPRGEVELWPMLLEKAYAQLHGGWTEIVSGHAQDAVELLTGVPGHVVHGRHLDLAYMALWHRAHATMIVGTIPVPPGRAPDEWLASDAPAPFRRPGGELDRLHPEHAFIVRAVDERAGTVTLVNPWGIEDGAVVLGADDLQACIDSLHVTELDPTS